MSDRALNVLIAGLPENLVDWLAPQLSGVTVTAAASAAEVTEHMNSSLWSLLVIDDDLPGSARRAVGAARQRDGFVPVLYCLDRADAPGMLRSLVRDIRVDRVLFHPLDRQELAIQAAALLGLSRDVEGSRRDAHERLSAGMSALWDRVRPTLFDRLTQIETALEDLTVGAISPARRDHARQEAHKLAGTVGTFGFPNATQHALALEQLFTEDSAHTDDVRVGALHLSGLRRMLSTRPVAGGVSDDARPDPVVLIVDADPALRRLVENCVARSMDLRAVPDLDPQLASTAMPDLVVVGQPAETDGLDLLSALSTRMPPVATVVLTDPGQPLDRVAAMRVGARGFIPRSLPPDELTTALETLLDELRGHVVTVLAVDDDPVVLDTLQTLLMPAGMDVTTINSALVFWDELERTAPDLVIIDIDMPHVSGLELCRLVRGSSRWATLPVIFLTARSDSEAIERVFAAGADDFVSKPVIATELLTRIHNRLERVRLFRELADTDPLTGLSNRRASERELDRLLAMATRYHEPLSIAVIDLDHFKAVNDRWGHATGDMVLRHLGHQLHQNLRGQDVSARWGGEEFVVGMYGIGVRGAWDRLTDILRAFRAKEFSAPGGTEFSVTFSAGIAAYPHDSDSIHGLYRAADAALYRAKADGRNRITCAAAPAPSPAYRASATRL